MAPNNTSEWLMNEEKMPSLISSDTSRSNDRSLDLSNNYDVNDDYGPIVHRRHTDTDAVRHRSRSRPKTKSRSSSKARRRFSVSRRASLGGTTIYPTPDMATLDTHLRSTSGLRLQTDGTCKFVFEGQTFLIESKDIGDFMFYASLGQLNELKGRNKPMDLLKAMAHWNEDMKQRYGAENSGLLRLDNSSDAEDPKVSFVYYGHMDDVNNSEHLQKTLDDFVDDALDFADKIHGLKEDKADASGLNKDTKQPPQKEMATSATANNNNNIIPDNNKPNPTKKSVFTKIVSSLRSNRTNNDIGSNISDSAHAFVVDKNDQGKIKPSIVLSRSDSMKKGSSFGAQDPMYNGLHPRIEALMRGKSRRKSSSFSVDDNISNNASTRKSKNNSYLENESDYEALNRSIGIFDRFGSALDNAADRFHQSEPVVSPRCDYPSTTQHRNTSRRHSSVAPQHTSTHRRIKRHSIHDARYANNNGSNHDHRRRHSQSDPLMLQKGNTKVPPPPF